MPKQVPAEAGFFRVSLRVPSPRDMADTFHRDFDQWIGAMAESEFAGGLGGMPSIRLDAVADEYAEVVLEWDNVPATGPWDAVEQQIEEIAKVAFPDLLRVPDELIATVTRVRAIGRDVVLDDETIARLDREADASLRWAGE